MSEYSVKDYGRITNTKIYGLDESIIRAKYPMSVDISTLNSDVTKGILALAGCEKGSTCRSLQYVCRFSCIAEGNNIFQE